MCFQQLFRRNGNNPYFFRGGEFCGFAGKADLGTGRKYRYIGRTVGTFYNLAAGGFHQSFPLRVGFFQYGQILAAQY